MENYEEPINIYWREIQSAKAAGFSREEGKNLARSAVYAAYPAMNGNMEFWSKIGPMVQRFWPVVRERKERKERTEKAEVTVNPNTAGKINFMDVIREAAKTGFIPKGKFLATFINGKSEQISSYISFLEKEGNFLIEMTSYGYVCTPVVKVKTVAEQIKEHEEAMLKCLTDGDSASAFKHFSAITELRKSK